MTDRRGWWAAVALLAGTVGQLLVGTLVPGLPQFEGKAFAGAAAYTDTLGDEVLGCLGAALAALLTVRRTRRRTGELPHPA